MKFVDDFVDYCRDFTGCPEIFLRWSAMLALSAVAGNKQFMPRGDWGVRPNIYIALIGNSSAYKSAGLNSARRLLRQACEGIHAAQEYSYEAMVEDIAQNPHRLFTYSELEGWLKMMNQKYNSMMKKCFMDLWDGEPLERKIKGKDGHGETHIIHNPYICLGGASTPFQIAEQINGNTSDFMSGLFSRILWIPYFGKEKSVIDPPPSDPIKAEALVNRLKELALRGERVYSYSPEAKEAKDSWLERFNKRMEEAEPILSSFYLKMRDAYFHRIAILCAFERDEHIISYEDVCETVDLLWPIEKNWPSLISMMTQKQWDRDIERVEIFIRKHQEVTHSEILRGLRGIQAFKLKDILSGLVMDEKIEALQEKTEGRPSKKYRILA